jgi:dTMP kinase
LESRDGVFIVIEGIDGSGKTLHSRNLCFQLRKKGFACKYTAEPSKGYIGRLLRHEFLSRRKISPEIETLLFAADRFHHIKYDILPMLRRNFIVISDRYHYASIAYQGAQDVDIKWIRNVNNFIIKPDLAIYLDVPAEIGLGRIRRTKSLMEKLDLEKKVREIYLDLVKEKELTYLDANKSIDNVNKEMFNLVIRSIYKKQKKEM